MVINKSMDNILDDRNERENCNSKQRNLDMAAGFLQKGLKHTETLKSNSMTMGHSTQQPFLPHRAGTLSHRDGVDSLGVGR